MSMSDCVVVILTFNCVGIIRETVTQASKVSPHILVVDSGSTDGTLDVLATMGCMVQNRAFSNYSDQRNWAIAQVCEQFAWQLHLDADEVLDDDAIASIRSELLSPTHDAYLIRRRDYFLGRMLRYSGLNPWHLRLFRSGHGQCEARLYDQHFITEATVGRLLGFMHDKNDLDLATWIARHNRWSDLEAKESVDLDLSSAHRLSGRLLGDARERTRYFKRTYYRLPSSLRAVAYFIYRYVFCLGFLDGREGFYFAFFQALWFRMLVDAKAWEMRKPKKS
jgi:glycosyltransferase involved in cell wall biosynthesis